MPLKKNDLYQQIKYWGLIISIPFIFIAGPLTGFIIGEYLQNRYNSGPLLFIGVISGTVASIIEIFRIIKFINKDLS